MNAITTAVAPVARRAIVVGTAEVTFTPYVIRKVGEVRKVQIDGVEQNVIYNERRNLTYLVLDIDGVPTTGRIAAELVDGQGYGSCKKSVRVAPPAGKKSAVTAKGANGDIPEVDAQPVAKKARKPKA